MPAALLPILPVHSIHLDSSSACQNQWASLDGSCKVLSSDGTVVLLLNMASGSLICTVGGPMVCGYGTYAISQCYAVKVTILMVDKSVT